MSTWYQTSFYGKPEIKEVEVVKETAQFITVTYTYKEWGTGKEVRREMRSKKGDEYFPTYAEARTALLDCYKKRMENAKKSYDQDKMHWNMAFMLEEPK